MTTIEEVAYHEAGHAVVSCILRIPITKVSIINDGDSLGLVNGDEVRYEKILDVLKEWGNTIPDFETRARTMVKKDLVNCYAGAAAVTIQTGRYVKIEGTDRKTAIMLMSFLNDYDWENYYDKAKKILQDNWPAVKALARALTEKKEMSGRKAREIIKATKPRYA